MKDDGVRILIVGGGIAGLSLAKALEQRGLRADLVERQSGEITGGAGLYLPGNAARAINQLGLLPAVVEKAVPIKSQRILDSRGKQLSVTQTDDVWRTCGPCLSLPRNTLQEILQSSLLQTEIRFSQSIADIKRSDGVCEVIFGDGAARTYDLVVGADGVNSAVRRIAFPDIAPDYVGNVSWRFITRNTAGIDCWTVMLGDGRALLAIPVSPTEVYVYADLAVAADAAGEYSENTSLQSLFDGFAPPVFPLIASMPADTNVHFGRIEQVRMIDWVHGRVVLIGDAAHASSPSMAEGAGMAMEDALVLADALAHESDVDMALAVYARRRRPRIAWVQKQCAARDKMRLLPALARASILKLFGSAMYKRSYAPLLEPV